MIKFTCFKNELYEAIMKVADCTVVKTTMPYLESIRFRLKDNSLELSGFNMEYGIRTNIAVEVTEETKTGEFLVLPNLIGNAIRRMDSEKISISVNDKYIITLESTDTKFTISAAYAGEFPELPTVEEVDPIEIDESIFKSMIRQTKYATSNNEMNPYMLGELFEIENGDMHLVALDGFRLAICHREVNCLKNYKFIIHKKAITLIDKFLRDDSEEKIDIFCNKTHALFKLHNALFFVRLMEGEFHNYKKTIPISCKTEVIIDDTKLTHALDRCSLLINDKNKSPIRCSFENDKLNIKCETSIGKVDDNISIVMTGENVNIGFNNQYLFEAAKFADCEKIKIQLSGPTGIVQIVPTSGDTFRFLLMPVRINN